MSLCKINYKEYPEYMFAIVAAYLPEWQGYDLRRVAGSVVFRHTDNKGNTYKNGALHSYNDMPAVIHGDYQTWYKNGKIHRDGDNPAIICNYTKIKHGFIDTYRGWYKNGLRHRQGDLPAVIYKNKQEWWKNGKLHRDGDKPAVMNVNYEGWWKHGKVHRDGNLPAIIDHNYMCWYKSDVRVASNYGRIGVYIEIEPIINEPSLIKLFFNGINMVTYLLLLMINIVKQ